VLLVGAGGAASGVLGPLIEARPAEVVLVNRTVEKAQALAASHAAFAGQHGVVLRAGGLGEPGEAFDVVLNSSASSLQGAEVPVPSGVLKPGTLAVDLMYGPAAAGFIGWAQAHGATGRDGLGMLVEQAAEAFFVWRGVRPATTPVLAALRDKLASKTP
jgi:shikimate dehydrogenase